MGIVAKPKPDAGGRLNGEPAPHLYLPIHQAHEDGVAWLANNRYWLLRTTVDPLTLIMGYAT